MGIPERYAGFPPLTISILNRLNGLPEILDSGGADLAYLFGSALSSRTPQDIDIAILAPSFDEVGSRVAEFLGTDRLDIVDLRHIGDSLLLHILRTGTLLFRRSTSLENGFEMEALRRIQDQAPWRRRQDEILRRRSLA